MTGEICTTYLEISPKVSSLAGMKLTLFFLSGILILTGCSGSDSEESATALPTLKPVSTCTNREFLDELSVKKINRNPGEFKGKCGFINIKILEIFPVDKTLIDRGFPSNCAVAASYQSGIEYSINYPFDGIFFFSKCADYDKVFEGDVYKVLAVVDTVNTQNNGDRIAQFEVVETRVYEDFSDRLIG
jgi:hypothetical protein